MSVGDAGGFPLHAGSVWARDVGCFSFGNVVSGLL